MQNSVRFNTGNYSQSTIKERPLKNDVAHACITQPHTTTKNILPGI